VTEFMPNGTLADEYQKGRRGDPTSIFHRNNPQNSDINNQPRPPLIQKVRIVSRIAFAIASCHSLPKPIVHLDIAARNVLLDKKKQPKLCDFGLAAFQDDMVEIHRDRAELLQTGDSWDQVLMKEVSIIQEKTTDPRKLALYQHVHKHTDEKLCMRWRPPSACGPNPLFDWKMDVYGFGCLMFELATESFPHADVMDEKEVRAQKSVEGAPQCDLSPTNVDIEYDAIMMRCLAPDPPRMIEIAEDLDRLYMKLRRGNYADHETDVQKLFQGVQSARTADPSQRNKAVQPDADNIVTFSFPPHIRFEAKHSDLQTRWETCGEVQEVLQKEIKITLHSWDYDSIAKLLQCIKVENRKPNIVVLVDCLEALGKLAEQADGPSDEQWESVARAVLMLLEAVDKCEDKIADDHYRAIATSGLYAFSRLGENRADAPAINILSPNSMPNSMRDDNSASQTPLHTMALNIVSNIIRRDIFTDAGNLQERICDAICALSSSAMGSYSKVAAREAMYQKGLVLALLEILCQQQRLGNVSVINTAIEALLCFQTDQLLAPNPPTLLSSGFHFQQQGRSGGASVMQEASNYPSVFSILFAFLKNFAGNWKDEKQERLPTLEATTTATHIALLERVAKALVDICQNSEPEQVPKLVTEMDRQSIRFLLSLIQSFKESFSIQEGVVGLLRFAVVAEAEENKADKIGVIAEFDPSFSLFVQAMNMFPRDKNLVQTVNPATSSFKPSFNTNIASSVSRVPVSMASRSPMFAGDMVQAMLGDFKSWLNELRQDDIDRQHSAARLQLSAAIVLGTACSVHDKAQQALTTSHCCLHIVTALRTFRTDVSLVTYGCAALSHICRKNTAHQNVLSQFGILAVLLECLNMHATEWGVMEGILMVLVALLEPSPQILQKLEGPAAAPAEKKAESDDEEETDDFSGSSTQKANKLREAEAEAKRKLKVKRDAERKAQVSAQLAVWLLDSKLWRRLVDECMYRSTLPWCAGLAASFLKLIGAFLYWIPQKMDDWSRAFEEWSDEMRTVDVLRKIFFAQFNQSKATEIRRALRDTTSERPRLQVYVLSALEMWQRLPKEATSFAMKQDQRAVAPVHAAGLAILVALVTKKTPENYRNLGDELALDIDADELEALLSLAITGFHAAISLPHQPAPILLKYSLWLMILMLSDPRWAKMHGAEMSVAACLLTQGVTPALLIDLLQNYRYFRSLQSLLIILLTKLYEIGHLVAVADEVSRLRQLIVSTAGLNEFVPDEGHDTVTMGFFKYTKLTEQCTALKKALDKFEAGTQEEEKKAEPVWDGKNRPHTIEVTAALSDGKEVKFHIKVHWNSKKAFWPLQRSYAEFTKLNKYFFEKYELKFKFPADSFLSLKDAALEARRLGLQDYVNELLKNPFICHNEQFMKFFLISDQKDLKFCSTPTTTQLQCPGFEGFGTDVVVADEKQAVFCSFAKDNKRGAVAVYRSGQLAFHIQVNSGVFKLAWNPIRQSLALLLAKGVIQFYSYTEDSLKEESKVKLLSAPASSFAHSRESPYLYAASTDAKVIVFDTAAGTPSASAHTNKVITLATAFEEKEQLLFLGTNTGELKVCCLKNAQALASPLCNLKLGPAGQLTAMCYAAEIEVLFVIIDDELICLSLTETEVANAENRSVKSKIMRSKDQAASLVKVRYSLKGFNFGPKQLASSVVFMHTVAPFPAFFLAVASSNGIVDLFQLPRSLDNPATKPKGYRGFDLISSWKFKPNSLGKVAYAPFTQTLYVCVEDKTLAISVAAYIPRGNPVAQEGDDNED